MTKNEVIALCSEVRVSPFYQLIYVEMDGTDATATFTHGQYQKEMAKDHPWCMPGGSEAWYDDEASEALQDAWYEAAREARQAIREWEATHKGKIPQWAKSF